MSVIVPADLPSNQTQYADGVGDIDECWIFATYTCVRYAAGPVPLPPVTPFRAAAGVPDRVDRPDGGTIDDVIAGVRFFWPGLQIVRLYARPWDELVRYLDRGYMANLSVLSSRLPLRLQYGFGGGHAVAVAKRGDVFYLANPLARQGTPMEIVPEADLRAAALSWGGGTVLAVLFPKEAPVSIFVRRDVTGIFTIPAGKAVRGWRMSATGDWEVARTWKAAAAPSSAAFDYRLLRASGTAAPSSVLHVSNGYFEDLFVSTADVEEAYDPPAPPPVDPRVAELEAQAKAAAAARDAALASVARAKALAGEIGSL